ncbi:MAG: FliI/YscN family ATPase [Planctomycetes bacterium]|nr:FliI/YscN family ATPase [Planctomycetota bacterium]
MILDAKRFTKEIHAGCQPVYRGRVDIVSGVMIEAAGIPAAMGELCRIERGRLGPIHAEVVGFRGASTLLMPHGDIAGIAPMQEVTALGRPFTAPVGNELLGRILDAFGKPLDGGPPLTHVDERPVRRDAPDPLDRPAIDEVLQTGVRVIDGLATIGRGQRLGIFAGSGVGKSSLLGQITRGTDADVVVVALVGERGREVGQFVHEVLGPEGSKKSVLVVATSDRAPIERYLAPFVAVTIAEHFRDQGLDVLLVMDSVTRFAAASREIGLAAGEPPTVRGYPPSFFATVPKLVERMGRTKKGSITGLLTVLVDGDDPNEPVADTLRGLLDGHLFLKRELAQAGHFPAVDVLGSLSRLMNGLVTPEQKKSADFVRQCLAAWREGRDLIEIGAYKPGANPRLDVAVARMGGIEAFLRQGMGEVSNYAETKELMQLLARGAESKP